MKKTIFVSVVAFLFLFGCTKAHNELNVNPNENQLKVPPSNFTLSHTGTGGYYSPLVCEGVTADYLWGDLNWHCTMHYVNGNLENMIMTYRGSLTSEKTGEVFIIKETQNWNHPQGGMIAIQSNIRGNKGTHILTFGFVNMETGEFTIEKTICLPN